MKQFQIDNIDDSIDLSVLFKNKDFKIFYDELANTPSSRKLAHILSIEEEAMIRFYTTAKGYKEFNQYLRGTKKKVDPQYEAQEKLLNSAISKLPKYEGNVFRGIGKEESTFALNLKIGDNIHFKQFTSATFEEEIADIFRVKNGGTAQYFIKSKNGTNISNTSEAFFEGEVLFKSNSTFKVVDVQMKPRFIESDPIVKEI